MDGHVICCGQRDLSYLCLHPLLHPFSFLHYLPVFEPSSVFFGPQQSPCLISSLLFYSFFHFLSHLFWLTLTVYLDSPVSSLCILQSLCCTPTHHPPQHHPVLFPPKLLFSMDTAVVLFAFRRHEYLQLCMFEILWWARDSHHCAVCACARMHRSRERGFLHLGLCEFVHVCVCVLLVCAV